MLSPALRISTITIIYFALFFLFAVHTVFAHKVSVFAWLENDKVYTISKFSGGKKVKHGQIEVFESNGKKLLKGQTNQNGEFSFKIPQKTGIKIVLQAGMGHRAEWKIPVKEINEHLFPLTTKPKNLESAAIIPTKTEITNHYAKTNKSLPPCLSQKDLQNMIEQTLDNKLQSVILKLDKALNPDHDPDISGILGALGYIFGLVGIGAYFNYRKKYKDSLRS